MSFSKKTKYIAVNNNDKSKRKAPRVAQGSLKASPMIKPKVKENHSPEETATQPQGESQAGSSGDVGLMLRKVPVDTPPTVQITPQVPTSSKNDTDPILTISDLSNPRNKSSNTKKKGGHKAKFKNIESRFMTNPSSTKTISPAPPRKLTQKTQSRPMKAVHNDHMKPASSQKIEKKPNKVKRSTSNLSKNKIASTPMHDRHKTFFEADMSVIDHFKRKDRGNEAEADDYNGTICFSNANKENEDNDEKKPNVAVRKISQTDLDLLYSDYLCAAVMKRRQARAVRNRHNTAAEEISKANFDIMKRREENDSMKLKINEMEEKVKLNHDVDQQIQQLISLDKVATTAAKNYKDTCENLDSVRHVLPLDGIVRPNNAEFTVELQSLDETIAENLQLINEQVNECPDVLSVMTELSNEVAKIVEISPKCEKEVETLKQLTTKVELLKRQLNMEKNSCDNFMDYVFKHDENF